jgi:hypothetical protein
MFQMRHSRQDGRPATSARRSPWAPAFARSAIDRLRRVLPDREGSVAVMTAVSLASLMGFAGLAAQATMWYVAKRDLQGATDAAAYSAAIAEAGGANSTSFTADAKAVASQYGFTDGLNGVAVTINNPPTSGNFTSNVNAIEVIIQQPQPNLLASLVMPSAPTVSARAVAAPSSSTNNSDAPNCVIALDKGKVIDIQDSGTATLTLNSCGLSVNSTASDALNLSGTAQITAKTVSIVGNYTTSGNAKITASNGITTGASPVSDPYANVNIPAYSGCNSTKTSITASQTYSAGSGVYVFCGGLSISGTGSVTLNPGVYVIDGGSLSVSGSSTLNATNATIILTSSSGSAYGTVSISGTSTINISAPTGGATSGMAIFQDRNAPSSGSDSFSGTANVNVTGVLYFPSQAISYSGTSSTNSSQCTQLIGYTLSFSGTTTFGGNCKGAGVSGLGGASSGGGVALVE